MSELSDDQILVSWQKNALPWTQVIRQRQIESRRLVTDQAIIDVVLKRTPRSVLDLGCGEGWLARQLAAHQISVLGVDAVPALIEQAKSAGGGEFSCLTYEELAAGKLKVTVDAIVCNFSLLGEQAVEGVFKAAPALLAEPGVLIVQSLHPLMASANQPYRTGWRAGSWEGINGDFSDPAPWYFRTLASWLALYAEHGFKLCEIIEPLHPATQQPASMLFVGELGH
ncbi:MAG: methyltransferase domain-containing protein [Methylococcaceae bacterium]|jgi:2-polyprenyl-3-methyl-5-hydroxy-6-metoxy-1,4-benzoquinol methylase